MIASTTKINGLTTFQRARYLPIDGRVLAHIGQTVEPDTIVAEATLVPHIEVLDLRPVITGINRYDLDSMIERDVGEKIEAGDVIIATGGTLNRVLRATSNGIIRAITPTQVLIEVNKKPHRLRAAYHGKIIEIVPDRGVILQMNGAIVQGVWGNGHFAAGKLIAAGDLPNQVLEPKHLKADWADTIVVAGRCKSMDTLHRAKRLPLRGLIVGSFSSHLIPAVKTLKFPVIAINGFGPIGMDEISFRMLHSNQGRTIALNGQPWDRELGFRPETFIHIELEEHIPVMNTLVEYEVGQIVRVNTLPYLPQTGIIEKIRPEPALLPSGIKAMAADVKLKSGQHILVPLNNLDVIE